jgi:phage terminase small subunit
MPDITDMVTAGELTDKELRFIDEYLIDCNGSRAATAAGYEGPHIRSHASKLLQNPTISRVLALKRKQLSDERHITAGVIIDNLMETYSRAMQQEPVLEFDPEEKAMVPSGEWQFDGKTATRSMELVAKMLGYIDSKTKPGEGTGNGFTLNIITRAAQLEMKQAGITIDQRGAFVPRETIGEHRE